MERKKLGAGWEHTVYEGKNNPNIVVKVPNFKNQILMRTIGLGVEDIRKEIAERQLQLADTTIKAPRTKVMRSIDGKSYVIGQAHIKEDNGINITEAVHDLHIESLETILRLRTLLHMQ
jgi:hypothetical protein